MASRRSSRRSSVGVNNDDAYYQQGLISNRNDTSGTSADGAPSTTTRPNPPRRTSSSAIANRRSSSPTLMKKASTGSLRSEALAPAGTPHRTIRRSSSQMAMSSPVLGSRSSLAPQVEEELPPPPTASSIAAQHFAEELALHESSDTEVNTVVILHDACYGHRYSRPKTSKATLSMIVERPERIHAGILGITSAYVRMGERHAGGQHAPHPERSPSARLPFRIKRTKREVPVTSSAVTSVHGTGWMTELKNMCDSAGQKLATTGKELVRSDAAGRTSSQPAKAKLHEGDLYLCTESLAAFQGALGGVCDGVDAVFGAPASGQKPKNAFVCVRPPGHHCSADFPSGFCWLNNVHVGIEYATQTYGLTHAAIIDFDLHHGDGSQSMTWQHNDKVAKMGAKVPMTKKTAIGYFSLHDINSYPCEDGDTEKVQNASLCIEGAHNQTVWNVHLQTWKTEEDFWQLYQTRYKVLLDKARHFLQSHTARLKSTTSAPTPKAAIFLSAGFDASEWESQGMQRHKVNVPTEFYARLTADVVKLAHEHDLAVDGRVVSVLEGGYSDRALMSGVLSHLSGLCHDSMAETDDQQDQNGLAWDMGKRMAALALGTIEVKAEDQDEQGSSQATEKYYYKTEWWQPDYLAELEALTGSQTPAPAPKKPAVPKFAPTFASPTQSFSAKVVDPSKIKQNSRSLSSSYSRPVTPPVPDVDWATAAHEMYKLLVPTDRSTRSCKPEELTETKARKARQSDIGVVPQDATAPAGRELRVRKTKTPAYADATSDNESIASKRSVSRSDRRKTLGDFPIAADPMAIPTTASGRPSAAVGRPPSATAVNVKKVRGKLTDTAVNGPPPVPKVPAPFASAKATPPSAAVPENTAPTALSMNGTVEDPVNAITTGLQRIKIKVPTEDERAAKLAKKKADIGAVEKKPAVPAVRTTAKKAAVPKAPKTNLKKTTSKTTSAASASENTKGPLVTSVAGVPVVAPQPEVAHPDASVLLQQPLPVLGDQPAVVNPIAPDAGPQSGMQWSASQVLPAAPASNYPSAMPYPTPPRETSLNPALADEQAIEQLVRRGKEITPTRPDTPPHPPSHLQPLADVQPVAQHNEFVPYKPPNPVSAGGNTHTFPAKATTPREAPTTQNLTWMPTNADVVQPYTQPASATHSVAQPAPPVPVVPSGISTTAGPTTAQTLETAPPSHVVAQPSVPPVLPPQMVGRPESRGRNLPVFTASSPIPFAPSGARVEKREGDVDIWDVPETPVKQ